MFQWLFALLDARLIFDKPIECKYVKVTNSETMIGKADASLGLDDCG